VNLLFLSFYYEPDLCAGSFRATPLARALVDADSSVRVEVLTTQPNRYGSFLADADSVQQDGRLCVRRFSLPAHRSGMYDQSQAFVAYARQVLWHVRGRNFDGVLATSSRLMTASLASAIARWKALPMYLDIRDIFVDTIGDVLPPRAARWAVGPFDLIERWTMQRACHINLVSAGFGDYFSTRYPQAPLSFFTNGIDDEFIEATERPPRERVDSATEVLYAGNVGEGQGLHLIIPSLAKRIPSFRFRIIGDGGRMATLREEVERQNLRNVILQPPVKRSELVAASLDADVLFLHLNDYPAFQKVLPSKLFEYGALGKPVWAGVSGYAAEFIR
jgi:glycosyltransferase involved in cell wall biosynthesis